MYVTGKRELSGSEATKEGGVQSGGLQAYQSLGSTAGRSWGTEKRQSAGCHHGTGTCGVLPNDISLSCSPIYSGDINQGRILRTTGNLSLLEMNE